MEIYLNTDKHIDGREGLANHVRGVVEASLSHVSERITRVEVHLSDENGDKSGPDDKRCMMEARLEGRHPTAVTCHAPTVDQAIDGAVEKLLHSLTHTLGRLAETR